MHIFANQKQHGPIGWFCAAALVVALGAAPSQVLAQNDEIKDGDITLAVESELLFNEAVSAHNVDVSTSNGVVTLSGTVDHLLAKDQAIRTAEVVKGVRSIIDRMKIKPVKRSDEQIRDDVVNALLMDPATDSYELDVTVNNDTVTLTGTVDSWQEKQLSEKVAKGVKGIKKIDNRVTVDYRADRPDHEIETEVRGSLELDPWIDEGLIEVKVDDGEVMLSGEVGSAAELRRASNTAWVNGVESVEDSKLEVKWWARDDMRRKEKYTARSDKQIKKTVKDAFLYDPRVYSFEPNVTVNNGVVTLTGVVDNLPAKRAAEKDARNTIGVWRVKNYLKVRPTEPLETPTLVANVRSALKRDPYVDENQVTVAVVNGKAHLYGVVDSHFEKSQAEDVVSRINGVVDVDNHLNVNYVWTWRSDREIMEEIKDEMWWSPFVDANEVSVSVEDGVATLTGEVDSWSERGAATENAFEGGARSVRNQLEVDGTSAGDVFYPSYEHYYHPYGYPDYYSTF